MTFKSMSGLAMGLIMAAGAAHAGTATGTFNSKIVINAACSVISASDIDFGTQASLAAAVTQQTSFTVDCSVGTPYNVGLDQGLGVGATTSNRLMSDGLGHTVSYSLFQDVGYLTNWGNSFPADTVPGNGSGANQAITVYGKVFPQPTPPSGTYTDKITITVNY